MDNIKLKEKNIFHLDEYLEKTSGESSESKKIIDISKDKNTRFQEICSAVKKYFQIEWEQEQGDKGEKYDVLLERQKKAIIGYKKEVSFFKDKIEEYIKVNNLSNEWHPKWYQNLSSAIFHENWGLAGINEWIEASSKAIEGSSSAKIIGDRIYFLIDGKQVLQKQTISYERRKQLRKALLLKTPKKRIGEDYHEVYMLNGTRITIFGEGKTKDGQDTFIFRKFFVKDYTFEKQAQLGTIPEYAIPLFQNMINVGFNVAFSGAVRTAKTTFLTTWQTYENKELEGIAVETDPEIPFHKIMPTAPIVQLVADGEELEGIVKSVLRADADYIIMAEARDATAFYIALEVTDRGTRRSKMTAHFSRAIDFPYNMAKKICEKYQADLYSTVLKVTQNFNYVFEFIQLQDKSKKRLKGIYELRYDSIEHKVTIHQICKYRHSTDDWCWKYDIGEDKRIIGEEENYDAFKMYDAELKRIAEKYPMPEDENHITQPAYNHLRR